MVYIKSSREIRKGKQLLLPPTGRMADILDAQADGPLGNYCCIKYHDGQAYADVTFKQFRDMTYAAAQALHEGLQGNVEDANQPIPVGYLSCSGTDFALNLFALLAHNVAPVLLSPRNSLDIVVHLVKESHAKVLIFEEEYAATANACAEKIPGLKLVKSLTLNPELLQSKPSSFKPLVDLSLEKAVGERTCVILHSSGSTSHPKLIRFSNRYILSLVDRQRQDDQLVNFGTNLLLSPIFHVFGLGFFITYFFNGGTTAFPSSKVPTPRQTLEYISATQATSMTCLPFQLKQTAEHLQENPDDWGKISAVERIVFGGATLPYIIFQMYSSKGIILQNGYGATEVGFLAFSCPILDNPNYQVLVLKKGVKYSLANVEGDTAQLLIHPDDANLATGIGTDQGYLVGDRIKIVRHDEKQDVLEFVVLARVDDLLVHVTGEKTNPIPLEDTLLTLPLIKKCVMFGTNWLSCCLFVELSAEAESVPVYEIVQQINLQVDKANANAPSHSRIDHSLIYCLPFKSTKLIPVTAKGNVSRAKAEKLFQDEINKLYAAYEAGPNPTTAPQTMDFDSISAYIGQAFAEVVKKPINNDISFFDQGMDSLLAVKFRNLLNSAYPTANLSVNAIYELENTTTLAKNILGDTQESKDLPFYQEQVDSFIKEYTKFPSPTTYHISPGLKTNFLVTGASGSLGSFIIKDLLEHDDVGTIFCFSRAKTSEESLEHIQKGFRERGIQVSPEQWKHICALPYVSDDEHLGLDDATYNKVFQSVDVIYHVAWRMDFLKGLPAFRDCVESTVNLLKISATSPRRPAFHFTSTVGATFPISNSPIIPEEKLSSALKNVQYCNGYNLSKIVSEILCYRWADEFGFPLDIHRVGQVSGDTANGAWNTREHISLLIKAAQVMKMAPSQLFDSVTWIPVDVAAKGMVEIHYSPNNLHNSTINHIVNPKATPWGDVLVILKELGIPCQAVDSSTFLNELKTNPQYQNVDINPLASLTDFFTSVLTTPPSTMRMETQSTCHRSASIDSCPHINGDLMKKYLSHWISIGFMKELRTSA